MKQYKYGTHRCTVATAETTTTTTFFAPLFPFFQQLFASTARQNRGHAKLADTSSFQKNKEIFRQILEFEINLDYDTEFHINSTELFTFDRVGHIGEAIWWKDGFSISNTAEGVADDDRSYFYHLNIFIMNNSIYLSILD